MKKKLVLVTVLAVTILAAFGLALAQRSHGLSNDALALAQGHDMKMMDMRSPATKKAAQQIQTEKKNQTKDGHYNCCLKHPCDHCAMGMGSCDCGMNASKDMPVCNECKGGWAAGDGAIPGKKAADIKTMPRGMKMKSEVAMTHSGKCPSCGTALVAAKGKAIYACAHCNTESAKPGKCPKCGDAMTKSLVTYACDKCHTSSAKAGKCPMCADKMTKHVLPIHA